MKKRLFRTVGGKGREKKQASYLAYATERVSLMTVTFTWPG